MYHDPLGDDLQFISKFEEDCIWSHSTIGGLHKLLGQTCAGHGSRHQISASTYRHNSCNSSQLQDALTRTEVFLPSPFCPLQGCLFLCRVTLCSGIF